MSANNGEAELLKRVEVLLERDPEGQDAALCELQKELITKRKEPATDVLENIFQLFGTTVGKQSKI
jgi:hypothetical protein